MTLGIELAQRLLPVSLLNFSVTVGHCGRETPWLGHMYLEAQGGTNTALPRLLKLLEHSDLLRAKIRTGILFSTVRQTPET